jgi:hypothetical protein
MVSLLVSRRNKETKHEWISNMKITKAQLTEIIKEELSGYLSNIYKWCPAGTKCAPEKKKTKWWKGR